MVGWSDVGLSWVSGVGEEELNFWSDERDDNWQGSDKGYSKQGVEMESYVNSVEARVTKMRQRKEM